MSKIFVYVCNNSAYFEVVFRICSDRFIGIHLQIYSKKKTHHCFLAISCLSYFSRRMLYKNKAAQLILFYFIYSQTRVFLFCVGYSLMFSCLFSKTWQVYRNFTKKSLSTVHLPYSQTTFTYY